jgi:hypothetical protein
VRGVLVDRLAVEKDLARGRPLKPGDRPKERRLAAAVGADAGEGLAVLDRERDLEEGLEIAVEDVDLLQLQHAHIGVPPM